MAPAPLDSVDDQVKAICQNLYNLMVTSLEHQGTPSERAMKHEISGLVSNLHALLQRTPHIIAPLPPEVIQYVEQGRNPDIYTREFVELVQKQNQQLKGKTDAFAQFRDILAKEISGAVPDLQPYVERIVENTGGKLER